MKRRRNKYNAKKCTYYGVTFDSLEEGNRYLYLLDRANRAEIFDLKVHPKFPIVDGFTDNQGRRQRPSYYIGDFQYQTFDGRTVVEDVKGVETALFRLKAKLFRRRYPEIDFRVVKV